MKFLDEVVFRKEYDGTGILFDARNGKQFYLNRTTTAICEAIEQGLGRDAIIGKLKAEFNNVPEDQVAPDVDEFLESLRKNNLCED